VPALTARFVILAAHLAYDPCKAPRQSHSASTAARTRATASMAVHCGGGTVVVVVVAGPLGITTTVPVIPKD